MHEFSLAQSVLEIAEKARLRAGASQVVAIELEIGLLSAVEPDAMRFAMDTLLCNTAASEALIRYRFVPGCASCHNCGREFELEYLYDPCPGCESFDKEIRAGEEMLVKSIQVN